MYGVGWSGVTVLGWSWVCVCACGLLMRLRVSVDGVNRRNRHCTFRLAETCDLFIPAKTKRADTGGGSVCEKASPNLSKKGQTHGNGLAVRAVESDESGECGACGGGCGGGCGAPSPHRLPITITLTLILRLAWQGAEAKGHQALSLPYPP